MEQASSADKSPRQKPQSLYDQLRLKNESDVRILELAPGQPSEPLRCRLRVDSLLNQEQPPYVALSYVWGAPNRTHALECNGQSILITETLDRALRHVRDPVKDHRLWIDQICIDQDHLEERMHQVHIMKRIYRDASKVVSWLGPDIENQAPLALNLIQQLIIVDQGRSRTIHFPTDPQLKELSLPSRDSPKWAALEALLQHQYFERVWVLQEVLMGYDVRLMWGDTEIRWAQVSGAYVCGTRYWMQIVDPQASARRCPMLSLERLEAFMMSSTTWISLLRATRRFGATDPKDKIFALIGLAEDETTLASDYSATLGEVYASAAKHIIRASGNLRVLAYVWIRDVDSLGGVPTWAPRWDDIADVRKTPKVLADWASYSASGQERVSLKESGEWGVLTLEGFVVDEVESLATPLDSWETLESTWWMVVAESLRIADSTGKSAERSADHLMVPFLWTITAGQSLGVNGLTCPATDPQHIEDFVAFAFNGLLQNWTPNGNPVCLREILDLVDFALKSLLISAPTDDRVYDDPEPSLDNADEASERESEGSRPDSPDSFEDEQDENQPPPDDELGQMPSDNGDDYSFSDVGLLGGIFDEGELSIHIDEDRQDTVDERNPFTLEVRGGQPENSRGEDDGPLENDPPDERQFGTIPHSEGQFGELLIDGSGFENHKIRLDAINEIQFIDNNSNKRPHSEYGESQFEERHPLEVIHQDDDARPDQNQFDASPMSRQWIENALHSFHPSDTSVAEAAVDIFARAHAKYDTAAVIRFMSQFEVSSVNRRFFVTKQGYMGVGPAYIGKGDIVCVLFGGSTPYILRPTTNEGEYLLLGECYVDGVMDGEALNLLEKGRRERQWFNLR